MSESGDILRVVFCALQQLHSVQGMAVFLQPLPALQKIQGRGSRRHGPEAWLGREMVNAPAQLDQALHTPFPDGVHQKCPHQGQAGEFAHGVGLAPPKRSLVQTQASRETVTTPTPFQ